MNNWQRLFVAIGLVLVVGMGTFPPWRYRFTYADRSLFSNGYASIWAPGAPAIKPPLAPTDEATKKAFLIAVKSPEYWESDLDIVRLLVQWDVVCFAVGGLLWAFRDAHHPETNHPGPESDVPAER